MRKTNVMFSIVSLEFVLLSSRSLMNARFDWVILKIWRRSFCRIGSGGSCSIFSSWFNWFYMRRKQFLNEFTNYPLTSDLRFLIVPFRSTWFVSVISFDVVFELTSYERLSPVECWLCKSLFSKKSFRWILSKGKNWHTFVRHSLRRTRSLSILQHPCSYLR